MTERYLQTASSPDFAAFLDQSVYQPLPADWLIGVTDVVSSTEAIAAGAYKSVNMAGAATIAAIANAIGRTDFPFVFGGDGASFAIRPADRPTAEAALAATVGWAAGDLGLTLRAALIPLTEIRAAGFDVRVAHYAVSESAGYAMFSGGGMRWADAALKAGKYAVDPAAADPPELTGLSCVWSALPAQHGLILSLIAEPLPDAPPAAFAALAARIIAVFDQDPRHGHPVPVDGPAFTWPPAGLSLGARATRGRGSLALRTLVIGAHTLALYLADLVANRLLRGRLMAYRRTVAVHTDFRKFDDALRLTVDCTAAQAAAVERLLQDALAAGIARYGLHRQDEALMTCFVPSGAPDEHLHFLDGADGGYARAARNMKAVTPT